MPTILESASSLLIHPPRSPFLVGVQDAQNHANEMDEVQRNDGPKAKSKPWSRETKRVQSGGVGWEMCHSKEPSGTCCIDLQSKQKYTHSKQGLPTQCLPQATNRGILSILLAVYALSAFKGMLDCTKGRLCKSANHHLAAR